MKEQELYEPVKNFLENRGYKVNAEVHECDITAQKDDELVVIELKTSFSLKLVYQAIDRQKFSDSVYVAIPLAPGRSYPPNFKQMVQLLKRLKVGLIFVHFLKAQTRVEIVLHPQAHVRKNNLSKRKAIIREGSLRISDTNVGGSTSNTRKITLYRQRAIEIAVALKQLGSASPAQLVKLGCYPQTQQILNKNYYGWFVKESRGIYSLNKEGKKALKLYPEIVSFFKKELKSSKSE